MKVLIATSGKRYSENAVQFAGRLLKPLRPDITLFHVKTPEEAGEDPAIFLGRGSEVLAKLKLGARSKIVESEEVADTVIKEISQGGYGMLVVGSRSVPKRLLGFSEYLLDQTPLDIITKTSLPTLVVKLPRSLQKILLVTSDLPGSERAVTMYGKLAQKHAQAGDGLSDARVNVVTVIPELYPRFEDWLGPIADSQLAVLESMPGERTKILYQAKKVLDSYGVHANIKLREGSVGEGILAEAERDYDLIVMSRRARRRQRRSATIGRQTLTVVSKSRISVLIV